MNDFPETFAKNMQALLGNESAPFFHAMNQPHAAALRLNPLRKAAKEAASEFIEAPVPWCPDGHYIAGGTRPGLSPLHEAGAYYIQEASAMAPAAVLNAQPGELILDLCAAPGGKSGQLAASLKGEGALISNEPDAGRAKILHTTLERLGYINAMVTNAWPEELAARFPETFDAILVDAPCSGEGMFRRDPASRGQWNENAPAGCAARQAGILDQAARMLKPGGRLVYSTCTFNTLENEGSITQFLIRHPDFAPSDFRLEGVGASQGGMIRLWPHKLRGDGHFAARLVKRGDFIPRRFLPAKPDKSALEPYERLLEMAPGLPALLKGFHAIRRGDYLLALPDILPDLAGLRAPCPALALCRIGKGYVEPSHTLAMALAPGGAARTAALDEAGALRYLRGEVLSSPEKGWTLAVHKDMPLGWGKASGGQLKNHLPKGLRRL